VNRPRVRSGHRRSGGAAAKAVASAPTRDRPAAPTTLPSQARTATVLRHLPDAVLTVLLEATRSPDSPSSLPLGNWWLHDGLHMVVGMHVGGLLAIEYGFQVTLIIAALALTWALAKMAQSRGAETTRRVEGHAATAR
jgi:hypothetical protein